MTVRSGRVPTNRMTFRADLRQLLYRRVVEPPYAGSLVANPQPCKQNFYDAGL